MSKTHLPITETAFDKLVFGLAATIERDGLAAAVEALTDDQLLIMVEVDDKLLSDSEGARIWWEGEKAWNTVLSAVRAEFEIR